MDMKRASPTPITKPTNVGIANLNVGDALIRLTSYCLEFTQPNLAHIEHRRQVKGGVAEIFLR